MLMRNMLAIADDKISTVIIRCEKVNLWLDICVARTRLLVDEFS